MSSPDLLDTLQQRLQSPLSDSQLESLSELIAADPKKYVAVMVEIRTQGIEIIPISLSPDDELDELVEWLTQLAATRKMVAEAFACMEATVVPNVCKKTSATVEYTWQQFRALCDSSIESTLDTTKQDLSDGIDAATDFGGDVRDRTAGMLSSLTGARQPATQPQTHIQHAYHQHVQHPHTPPQHIRHQHAHHEHQHALYQDTEHKQTGVLHRVSAVIRGVGRSQSVE